MYGRIQGTCSRFRPWSHTGAVPQPVCGTSGTAASTRKRRLQDAQKRAVKRAKRKGR